MNRHFKYFLISSVCFIYFIFLQGCAAELALLEEGGAAAAIGEGAALSETEMAVVAAEQRAIFGETLAPNTELTQLENVRAVFNGNNYPRLSVIRNRVTKDFAEIIGKRELRLLDGKGSIILNENVYVTKTSQADLYSNSTSISRIVKKINKGRLVLKIGERNGYYKVLVGRNKVLGYMKPSQLACLLIATTLTKSNYTVVSCSHCSGYGHSSCSGCFGKGYLNCNACNHKGYHVCNTCNGKGFHTCSSCYGKGYFTCSSCSGKGYHVCSSCIGKGYHTCSSCSGKGNFKDIYGNIIQCSSCGGNGTYGCTTCGGSGTYGCTTCGGSGTYGCTTCGGSGTYGCTTCGGSGTYSCTTCGGAGSYTCNMCNGYGTNQCAYCYGNGKIKSYKN